MAYLHCHDCDWQQDDFWSAQYNPIRSLLDYEQDLLGDNLDEIAIHSQDTAVCYGEREGDVSRREMIARACEQAASLIRGMAVPTEEQFDRESFVCPQCKGTNLDID